ncbi:MAG: tetratricopeptide repeat protein [Nitrospirae bacterium]|nr:tetratricopeptide repeat protein [Nitrospirota bacterium]
MFCKNCYANLPDGTETCPKCGTPLIGAGLKPAPTSTNGKGEQDNPPLPVAMLRSNESPAPFIKGGQKVDVGIREKEDTASKKDERQRTGLIIIGALAGVIVLLLAVVFYQWIAARQAATKGMEVQDRTAEEKGTVASANITLPLPMITEKQVENISTSDPMVMRYLKDGKDYLESGKHQNAVESFKMALEKDAANQDIKKAISATYGIIAVKKAETGNYKDAVEDYKNAINYSSDKDPKLYLGMGAAYLQLNKEPEAIDALNTAVGLDPNFLEAYHLLAELYYKSDDVAKAISYWEKVLSITPSDQKAAYYLSKAKREKDTSEKFTKEAASHFTLRFEGHEERDLGRIVISILEDAYREIGRELSAYPDTEVIVYLYTKQQFRDVTRSPSWAGALYDGKIRIPIGGYKNEFKELKKTLYHEYTHALVRSIVKNGRCPTWLNEGLAEHFEDKDMSDYRKELIKALQKNKVMMPVKNLEGSFTGFNSYQAQIAYTMSHAVVEFMIERYGMHNIKRVLEELGNNKTIEQAFSDGLTLSYEQFQKEWQENFLKG